LRERDNEGLSVPYDLFIDTPEFQGLFNCYETVVIFMFYLKFAYTFNNMNQ